MRKVRCVKGHFYDAEINAICPHCGSPEGKEEPKVNPIVQEEKKEVHTKSKKGIFWKKKTESKESQEISESINEEVKEEAKAPEKEESAYDYDEQKTHSFWTKPEESEMEVIVAKPEPEKPEPEKPELVVPKQKPVARDIDAVKTVSKYADDKGTEPVTGWLVCVKGENYGKSYEIATGQNCIGRDSSMEICIKDSSISREKQAYLIYEPKKSQFFLRSGDGAALTYHNDEMLCGMVPLNAYDRIQLGDAEFLFIPFCGEKFTWENNK